MLKLRTARSNSHAAAGDAVPAPPAWAADWANADADLREVAGVRLSVTSGRDATLVTAVADGARRGDGDAFHGRTSSVYRAVRAAVDASPHAHLVRMWNWIPGIHDGIDAGHDRYMVFNAARFAAMSEWFGGRERLARQVPAASGVGHDGDALVVHALAAGAPGEAVENPRQVPAYRYSRKYGPLPPCFARATRVTVPRPALLVAGTAAITGEQSRHPGDVERQLELTLENLRALLVAGGCRESGGGDVLRVMRRVRVYVPRTEDRETVGRLGRPAFAEDAVFEIFRADLCRAELLVEIEGAARDG